MSRAILTILASLLLGLQVPAQEFVIVPAFVIKPAPAPSPWKSWQNGWWRHEGTGAWWHAQHGTWPAGTTWGHTQVAPVTLPMMPMPMGGYCGPTR